MTRSDWRGPSSSSTTSSVPRRRLRVRSVSDFAVVVGEEGMSNPGGCYRLNVSKTDFPHGLIVQNSPVFTSGKRDARKAPNSKLQGNKLQAPIAARVSFWGTFNIQHSTPNIQCKHRRAAAGVRIER